MSGASGLDQQTTAWRVNDGQETHFYVALVIERHGQSPGPSYMQFVSARSPEIDRQLAFVQQMAVNLELGKRALPTADDLSTNNNNNNNNELDEPDDASAAPPPPPQPHSKRGLAGATVPNAKRRGHSQTQLSALSSSSSSSSARKPRANDKTHLHVCANPLALMDELNAQSANGDQKMHFFLAVVIGRFDSRFMADRLCDAWGRDSRGSGPRASWGDAIKTVYGVDMWIDIGIVFENFF